jgi:hypothetical protein
MPAHPATAIPAHYVLGYITSLKGHVTSPSVMEITHSCGKPRTQEGIPTGQVKIMFATAQEQCYYFVPLRRLPLIFGPCFKYGEGLAKVPVSGGNTKWPHKS